MKTEGTQMLIRGPLAAAVVVDSRLAIDLTSSGMSAPVPDSTASGPWAADPPASPGSSGRGPLKSTNSSCSRFITQSLILMDFCEEKEAGICKSRKM